MSPRKVRLVADLVRGKGVDEAIAMLKLNPRAAAKQVEKAINSAIFPGLQGGPLMHVIAAKAVAFHEALQPDFKKYQEQVDKDFLEEKKKNQDTLNDLNDYKKKQELAKAIAADKERQQAKK